MTKAIKVLSALVAVFMFLSACIGLFYTNGGEHFFVTNIYGQQIELFGDGIYSYNSLLKVGATKGTDIVMLVVSLILLVTVLCLSSRRYAKLLAAGLQSCILYNSIYLITGVSFNRLFPLYLVLFSTSLFAFILTVSSLKIEACFDEILYTKKLKGTAIFLIAGGCSVLVWLTNLVPAVLTGAPTGFIEIYTTEPTFAIDLGIILPTCLIAGVGLLKRHHFSYVLASILLTLFACVGLCVIFQTVVQTRLGIVLSIGQMTGIVVSFVILGIIALFLNYRLLKYAK